MRVPNTRASAAGRNTGSDPQSASFARLACRGRGADGTERTLAVAMLGRDRDALRAEAALERYDWDALDSLVPVPAGDHA